MNKFKVGDVVEREVGFRTTGTDGLPGGERGTVTGVLGAAVFIEGYESCLHLARTLRLVSEQDDPLPPAPTSVLYFNSDASKGNDQRLKAHISIDGCCVDITVIPRTNSPASKVVSVFHGLGVGLYPDDALQLAHDIRRMAMELKRKGK